MNFKKRVIEIYNHWYSLKKLPLKLRLLRLSKISSLPSVVPFFDFFGLPRGFLFLNGVEVALGSTSLMKLFLSLEMQV